MSRRSQVRQRVRDLRLARSWPPPFGVLAVPSDVAADEVAPSLIGGTHHHEAPRRRIDDQISGLRDAFDQALDQPYWFDVWMDLSVDLLNPTARDAVVSPVAWRHRRLLQDQEIVPTPARALT